VKLSQRKIELQLRHPFTIARGTSIVDPVVIVELEHEGIVGLGEAAPSSRYGESIESVQKFLSRLDLRPFESPFDIQLIRTHLDSLSQGDYSAKAAVDIALWDWVGKKLNAPLYKVWGVDRRSTPRTSFTIGIDTPEKIEEKVHEAEEFPILKIKLGGEEDELTMRTIRSVTMKTLRVDANEGWKRKELAVEKIKWLEQEGVEFVEQPMPANDLAAIAWVRERVNLPLIADENCVRLHDVPNLQHAFDGINIKLMKCTGPTEALAMIHAARACGMKIMMGCMIETSIAITAAAQLSPLIDYADLDGHVLITNDPYVGVQIQKGKLILPEGPGLGVTPRT
jgi:L-alanine-DL-glutamate epimerase-like enolase superfamily enzyme